MNIVLVSSAKDPASLNIYNSLIGIFDFKEYGKKFCDSKIFFLSNKIYLFLINEDLIYADNIDKEIEDILNKKIALAIFLSKHVSKENTPSFTVHSIGNWDKAGYGGKERTLCPTSPIFLKYFFAELDKNANNNENIKKNYQITMEATHHGPYVEAPAVFVEIGSTEKEWNNKENGNIISKTIMETLNKIKEKNKCRAAIGLGGTHYCNNFNKIMIKTNVAFGHICPKHMLEKLDIDLLKQAIEKNPVELAVLDWKGLWKEKQRIIGLLNELNIKYERSDKIMANN